MAIVKLTFDGANNTAKAEAAVNAFLTNYENGIILGLGNECTYTISNGKITFKDGYCSIYGRKVYIENGTNIQVDLDSEKNGFITLNINTQTNTAELGILEKSGSYPTLTQTNLLTSDGLYQFPLIKYTKTTTSIVPDTTWHSPTITTNKITFQNKATELTNKINETNNKINEYHTIITKVPQTKNGYYYIPLSEIPNLYRSIVMVDIAGDLVIFPGLLFSDTNYMSTESLPYKYGTTTYEMQIWEDSDDFWFGLGVNTHTIRRIYFCG